MPRKVLMMSAMHNIVSCCTTVSMKRSEKKDCPYATQNSIEQSQILKDMGIIKKRKKVALQDFISLVVVLLNVKNHRERERERASERTYTFTFISKCIICICSYGNRQSFSMHMKCAISTSTYILLLTGCYKVKLCPLEPNEIFKFLL